MNGEERDGPDEDSDETAGSNAERRYRNEQTEQQVLDRSEQTEHVRSEQ